MPHFYFDLQNGVGFIADEAGQDLPDEAAARRFAIDSIRSILSSEVKEGVLDLAGCIKIRTDSGGKVMQVAFDEAVRVHPRTRRDSDRTSSGAPAGEA